MQFLLELFNREPLAFGVVSFEVGHRISSCCYSYKWCEGNLGICPSPINNIKAVTAYNITAGVNPTSVFPEQYSAAL